MSEKIKYTPGPWRNGNHPAVIVADSKENITIPGCTDEDVMEHYGGNLIAESVSPGNAELIKLAPEMFGLLAKLAKLSPEMFELLKELVPHSQAVEEFFVKHGLIE